MITLTSTFTRPNTDTLLYKRYINWMDDQSLQSSYYTHYFDNYIDNGKATNVWSEIDQLNYKIVAVFANYDDFNEYISDPTIQAFHAARNAFLEATGTTVIHERE